MGRLMGWHRLVGTWVTEGANPQNPGEPVHGETTFEWLDDQQCLVQRIVWDHPSISDGLMVTAVLDGVPTMHFFNSHGVHSVFEVEITEEAWRFWSHDPADPRRWIGEFAEGGEEIRGRFERSPDGETWKSEFETTYRREPGRSPGLNRWAF